MHELQNIINVIGVLFSKVGPRIYLSEATPPPLPHPTLLSLLGYSGVQRLLDNGPNLQNILCLDTHSPHHPKLPFITNCLIGSPSSYREPVDARSPLHTARHCWGLNPCRRLCKQNHYQLVYRDFFYAHRLH